MHESTFSVSVSSTDKEVNLKWDKEYGKDAIAFFKHIEPLQFQLGEPVTYMHTTNYNGDQSDSNKLAFSSMSGVFVVCFCRMHCTRTISIMDGTSFIHTVFPSFGPTIDTTLHLRTFTYCTVGNFVVRKERKRRTKYFIFPFSKTTDQLHLLVRGHPPSASTDRKYHQHLRSLLPHCGRELGDLLDPGGGRPSQSGPQRHFTSHPLHTGACVCQPGSIPLQSSFLVPGTTPNGSVDEEGGVKGSKRNGCHDPKCPSAGRLRMVREDTGGPNEGSTCVWIATDAAVGCTSAFLRMWWCSRRLICRGCPDPGHRVNEISRIHWSSSKHNQSGLIDELLT
ncbi:UNVERIFIED_CONTAM: hypothetical protein NCL1_20185 [Trichonephila clavipes]